jgi:hypothetical protein
MTPADIFFTPEGDIFEKNTPDSHSGKILIRCGSRDIHMEFLFFQRVAGGTTMEASTTRQLPPK